MKKIIGNWWDKYRLHLFLWTAFIAYETILVALIFGASGRFAVFALHYALAIILFYVQAYYVLPGTIAFKNNAYWTIPLALLSEMLIFVALSYWGDWLLFYFNILPPSKVFGLTYSYTLKTIYRGILFMGFSAGYYFVIRYNSEKRRTAELEQQRLNNIIQQQKAEQELIKAQNAFLKAQINPHFLFNTLDFIYHRVVVSSPAIGEAVITLADMMRYAIDADKIGDYILLANEIEQAKNFLYLNQIRKKDGLAVNMNYDDEVLAVYLIPLVLLTLVENVFKHGDLDQPGDPASVNIYIKNQIFHIETRNLVTRRHKGPSTRAGLNNIEKRLKYAYGNAAVFTCQTDLDTHFTALVTIPCHLLQTPVGASATLPETGIE